MGPEENTPAAFARAAETPDADGVEFDIRRGQDGALVVIHDPQCPEDDPPSLAQILDLLKPTKLGIMAEIKESGLGKEVIEAIASRDLQDHSVVFGFPKAAATLPFDKPRNVPLGIIVHLPWQADRLITRYKPDIIMTGWDYRPWTRYAFRAWWTARSLRRLGKRHRAPVIAGIVRRKADHSWLKRQGVNIAVADLDMLDPDEIDQ